MAAYYLDTSAVLKRYVNEPERHWVRQLVDPARLNTIGIARISGAELVAAVVRRARGGGLSAALASRVLAEFHLNFAADYELIDATATTSRRRPATAHGSNPACSQSATSTAASRSSSTS